MVPTLRNKCHKICEMKIKRNQKKRNHEMSRDDGMNDDQQ